MSGGGDKLPHLARCRLSSRGRLHSRLLHRCSYPLDRNDECTEIKETQRNDARASLTRRPRFADRARGVPPDAHSRRPGPGRGPGGHIRGLCFLRPWSVLSHGAMSQRCHFQTTRRLQSPNFHQSVVMGQVALDGAAPSRPARGHLPRLCEGLTGWLLDGSSPC